MSEYSEQIDAMQVLRRPIIERAAGLIGIGPGTKGLDVGCGNGLQSMIFARMSQPGGTVNCLDASAELLEIARRNASEGSLGHNLDFTQARAADMPFEDDRFDWAVSIDCVGYGTGSFTEEISEMARVTRPGGIVALMAWTGQQILGGHAMLEAKLNATPAGLAPYRADTTPQNHFLGIAGRMRAAGLTNISAETICADFSGPLDQARQAALGSLMRMRWPNSSAYLSRSEQAILRSLSDPASPQFLLDKPDYHGMFFYLLFRGEKSAATP